jgi:hypothetical protein
MQCQGDCLTALFAAGGGNIGGHSGPRAIIGSLPLLNRFSEGTLTSINTHALGGSK